MGALPDFMIIGASRCGTTSLHMYLGEHPNTMPPTTGKELGYFSLQYNICSIRWYERQWPSESTGGLLKYESSTDYLHEAEVPKRIQFWIPDCKFIVLLRDPVKRAWSEYYNFWVKFYRITIQEFQELPKLVNRNTPEAKYSPYTKRTKYKLIQKGMYAKQLKRWFKYFPPRQFCIIKAEEFFANPGLGYQRCLEFLGLEPYSLEELRNYDPLRAPDQPYPDMPPSLERLYADYYRPFNEELYELLGGEFGW